MPTGTESPVDPTLLPNYPGLLPPEGVTPNYVDPYTLGYIIPIVGSILIATMVIFVVIRIYTKTYINRKLHWDDLTCVLASLFGIAYFVTSVYNVKAKVGTHQWNVRLLDLLTDAFCIPGYLDGILIPPSLLFTKVTFFLMYFQLFKPIKALRFCIYLGMIVTSGFYVAAAIAQLYFETPHRGETFVSHTLGPLISKSFILSVPLSAFGIFIDFYILILPIVAVLRLQLAKKRKVGLCVVFGTGSIACISSVLSLIYRIRLNRSRDITWAVFPVVLLVLVEICVGVICSCMPAFSCMFRHHLSAFKKLKSQLTSRYRSFRHLLSNRSGSNSIPSDTRSGDGFLTPNSSLESGQKSKKQPKSLPDLHSQFGQLNTLRTYIRGGHKSETTKEGIHVTQDIEQAWQRKSTATDEKHDCVAHS